MNYANVFASTIVVMAVLTGCTATDDATEGEQMAETTSPLESTSGSSGIPRSVLRNYDLWSVTGSNIPQEPPARSECSSSLDAVAYGVIGCLDPKGNDVNLSSAASGIYCSSGDGAGVTSVQAACLGGWLMTIRAVNGKRIPSNVVLSGVNKVAKEVTRVILLECPNPSGGLAEHNVIYKAVYNNGIFAPRTPDGCTPYELAPR